MRITIFGLAVSSSWGNGHASLWRGLISGLLDMGHRVTFFERDVPYYAQARDLNALPEGGRLVLYPDWNEVLPDARQAVAESDAAIVTSYCPDGVAACRLVRESTRAVRAFYDLDTPVTLARLEAGDPVAYLPPEGLDGFDLALSYTGGRALDLLQSRLGARRVAPLYGSVDPAAHRPAAPRPEFDALLGYLGTYAEDRQAVLERLFIEPARLLPASTFIIAGAQYPESFPWASNVRFAWHLPVPDHSAFYCSQRLTLNITRSSMAWLGWCPSGRLFEAAACGVPVLSDWWEGLDEFFAPGDEILVAHTTEDALDALRREPGELRSIARRARERTLAEHTARARAADLVAALESAASVHAA